MTSKMHQGTCLHEKVFFCYWQMPYAEYYCRFFFQIVLSGHLIFFFEEEEENNGPKEFRHQVRTSHWVIPETHLCQNFAWISHHWRTDGSTNRRTDSGEYWWIMDWKWCNVIWRKKVFKTNHLKINHWQLNEENGRYRTGSVRWQQFVVFIRDESVTCIPC